MNFKNILILVVLITVLPFCKSKQAKKRSKFLKENPNYPYIIEKVPVSKNVK